MPHYPDTLLFIDGQWTASGDNRFIDVVNPATEQVIGRVAHAGQPELAAAVVAAERGFAVWSRMSVFDRYKIMREAATLLRARVGTIAPIMTMEQGKPLGEARVELLAAADTIDWLAEEGRRTYGRLVPSRATGVTQAVIRTPVGPVAAFSPWNFPVNQVVRKVGAALATGCSIIVKAAEETPGSPAELIRAFADAGVPPGVIGLVYGTPSEISETLIAHPAIRKVTFTGSTAVGKMLAALAGSHMKRATMELGGHGPAIVCADADVDQAATTLAAAKFRNAGQVCVSPTRFLVERPVFGRFVERFAALAAAHKVGDGLEPGTTMGPMANVRRIDAMESLIADATAKGAEIVTGGHRVGNSGYFFAPTVLSGLTGEMRIMNEEPFGPVALMCPFDTLDQVVTEANRLPYGLAAYAFTGSGRTAARLRDEVRTGMLTVNHLGLAFPEVPFGGIGDSGYGSEGGTEALEAYLDTRLFTMREYV
ncbi:NAD-dependent succinate-semialdehyde dehydrogenase [Gluconacetobacter azotocaptans]|uniref:NAD-dependent succinate-semialdehyde dehydrogenase n=1 Tax=Gluconacetobacter azotocaptans TaxID=142834 RepID=A0A7W4JPU3_9PROT|nr:NAD-dependent succinate-semialdehyde dehydrogenase [Gluconacetobacter azotocaptans]MBB2188602.1 NAD-dependent succinate-semialdehyde dehydrogenase [Gluconacetobacter azotocaptans]MBM9400306.1 NAD-dependent succinate-semialdehyde dehydrogenase [Gluconacetobacter azotocaptans]GBQ35400.1 aldehyde dehydrogenase [Gluconacetobacter azotocaptans DSM 13594]